ncbi:MAG TPA: glycosyltransferase family 2 protein [Anaerolineae bacterium]|nr:glycosyltransferase family 2 protein [Anaerolineae bacterium]HMR64525.1 glycosyltransferase family 2 protein [Anaerolineae bacterium]
MKLKISIVNHNSVQPLRDCLLSLLENVKGLEHEIYVVDNLCQERAGEMLAREFPQVKVLSNNQVLGFGANHNQVLKQILDDSDYVLVLNPDTVLPPGSVPRMLDFLQTHETVAVCSPTLIGTDGPWTSIPERSVKLHRDALLIAMYISNAGGLNRWLDRLRGRGQPADPEPRSQPAPAVDRAGDGAEYREVIVGACMLFRSAALREVGLFDEQFFLYFEEYDWCLRAKAKNWRICWLRNVEIYHLKGYSTTRLDFLEHLLILVESWVHYYRKHGGKGAGWVLQLWLIGVASFNTVRWSLTYLVRPKQRGVVGPWRAFSVNLIRKMVNA